MFKACNNFLPITYLGLDPAGPLFTFPFIVAPPEKRLARTDATFVQVIHTAAKTLGTQICMGDADFWANGGEMQPGCLDLNPIVALSTSELTCWKFPRI